MDIVPDWIINVGENLSKMEPFQPKEETPKNGRRCSIHRAPHGWEARKFPHHEYPISPYLREHDNYRPNKNEEHALIQFLRRSGKPPELYYKAVVDVVEELKDAYEHNQLVDKWKWKDDTDAFLKLMVHSGCLLIEMLRGSISPESYYAPGSPLMKIHKHPSHIERFRHEVLALENQLPMLLLKVLLDVETGGNHNHVHEDAGNDFTSYIYFMRSLIRSANDVSILQSPAIINPSLHSDQVAQLFNRLSNNISSNPHTTSTRRDLEFGERVRERFDKMSNEWRKDLFQNYLRSPWAMVSVIAATLLFTLIIIQTVYTVLSYVNRNK